MSVRLINLQPAKYTSRVKDGNYTESEVDETDDNNNIVTDSDSDSDVSQARKDDNDRIGKPNLLSK